MRAVNLLTTVAPARGRGHSWRELNALTAGAAGAVLMCLVLGALFALESSRISSTREDLERTRAELAGGAQQQEAGGELRAREAALETALSSRVAWDRMLRNVSRVLPSDVWVTALTGQAPASAVASAAGSTAVGGTSTPFRITGYTYSQTRVAHVLKRLALVPELSNVQLESSAKAVIVNRPVLQFTVTANIQTGVS